MKNAPGEASPRRRIHWHIVLTHFPISLYGVSAGFQILHLFLLPTCFENATNVCLIGAVVMMIPTTISGWNTWRTQYRGFRSVIFQRKIAIAFGMLGLSLPLVVWRTVFLPAFTDQPWGFPHWLYLAGVIVLIIGAVLEGFYGGSLHHK